MEILKFVSIWSVILVLVLETQVEVSGARILALFLMSSRSMRNILDSLVEELAHRGHQITVVSPIPSNSSKNIRHICGEDAHAKTDKVPNMFETRANRESSNPFFDIVDFLDGICRNQLEMPEVQQLLDEPFDLVMVNLLFNECAYGLASQFKVPIIGISPQSSVAWMSSAMGAPVPPSFVPIYLRGLTHRMTFLERVDNFYTYLWSYCWRQFFYLPKIERVYRDYFPGAISVNEFESKLINLVLMNSHPVLNYPRPLMPNMIEVGGMHCKQAKPLSKDLEDFVEGSGEDGFIYFSMGSITPGSSMPDVYRKTILATFKMLKQRVIWKWETETMEDLPPNVKLCKWLPQQDILGHPKIKLFITHGGLLSIEEAVFHGVPLIGIPMFSDQDLNMRQAEMAQFALTQEFGEIRGDVLYEKIQRILSTPSFTNKVKELSRIFRDDPSGALERGVYWVEYLLRHGNTSHLNSAGRDLNFVQFHSIDAILTLLLIGLIGAYAVYKIVYWASIRFSIRKFGIFIIPPQALRNLNQVQVFMDEKKKR